MISYLMYFQRYIVINLLGISFFMIQVKFKNPISLRHLEIFQSSRHVQPNWSPKKKTSNKHNQIHSTLDALDKIQTTYPTQMNQKDYDKMQLTLDGLDQIQLDLVGFV